MNRMRTRPHKLQDPDEVERICRQYLDNCAESRAAARVQVKNGEYRTYGKWPSMVGLALALGIDKGTLQRYIAAHKPDNDIERERTYGESESVLSSNSRTDNLSVAQDTSSCDLIALDASNADKQYKSDSDIEYEEAQRQIRGTLARTRDEIEDTIFQGSSTGLIDSRTAAMLLGSFGYSDKPTQDNTKKIEFVNYDADDMKALFT